MISLPAFNVLEEPWIPVRTRTGEVSDVSLTDALLNARAYAALAETSPPNLIALYRVLLAALARAVLVVPLHQPLHHCIVHWKPDRANGATPTVRAGSTKDCPKRRFENIWSELPTPIVVLRQEPVRTTANQLHRIIARELRERACIKVDPDVVQRGRFTLHDRAAPEVGLYVSAMRRHHGDDRLA